MEKNIAAMKNIKIIYSSNLRGNLEEIAKLATLLKEVTVKYDPCILLNTGNTSWGTEESNYFKGEPVWKALKSNNYHAVGLGPEDFLHGWKNLKHFIPLTGVPVTICNLYYTKEDVRVKEIQPYIVLSKYKGMKVGIAGVIDEKIEFEREDEVFLEYSDNSAIWAVKQLKKEGCNMIGLIAYMNMERCKELAGKVEGLDFIICSDPSQTELNDIVKVNNCIISCKNTKGDKLGIIEMDKV